MSREVVLLASASPRRRLLLESIDVEVIVIPPAIDDAHAPTREPDTARLVESLAWFKAAQVLADPRAAEARARAAWLVAADTLCVVDGRPLGKPRDVEEARAMILGFAGRRHEVFTGVTLVALRTMERRMLHDRAVIELGRIPEQLLEKHLKGNGWRGRAGGYNLAEVVEAGWPITCEGDPSTVMGLPLQRLAPLFRPVPSDQAPSPGRAA